ncbi:tRNA-dihydrouridine synthase [Oceanimonas sp. NS1]|nr:tRNA-dihydrouridine synthase [Oceanimonas sp. NS1]
MLDYTGADAIMIGRAAQGRPWIFREIRHYLEHGTTPAPLPMEQEQAMIREHVTALHDFYGEVMGVRIARKHVGWYLQESDAGRDFRRNFNALEEAGQQLDALEQFFANNSLTNNRRAD